MKSIVEQYAADKKSLTEDMSGYNNWKPEDSVKSNALGYAELRDLAIELRTGLGLHLKEDCRLCDELLKRSETLLWR